MRRRSAITGTAPPAGQRGRRAGRRRSGTCCAPARQGPPPPRARAWLAISKELVEAHGGRIRAESPGAGRGATFTFTLPAAGEAGASAAVPAAVSPATPGPGEPPRILVVDDDSRALRFVRDALSEAGYAPLVTGMPQDLPRIIRTERPRLVLLDLMLPEVDGIKLMAQVPKLADLPVIFISV